MFFLKEYSLMDKQAAHCVAPFAKDKVVAVCGSVGDCLIIAVYSDGYVNDSATANIYALHDGSKEYLGEFSITKKHSADRNRVIDCAEKGRIVEWAATRIVPPIARFKNGKIYI